MAQASMASETDENPVISLRNVSLEFSKGKRHRQLRELLSKGRTGADTHKFWALNDISFDVKPGEAIGVVGRNGQGKSTLLKVIAGVLLADEGSVEVNGGVAPLIEITGGFNDNLPARENIYLVAGLHGMSKREVADKFDEIVEFAEVGEFLDTPYRHFSSGMKVRLAFSVVSQLRQPILLVDEVLAVGDAAFKKKCYKRIDELLADGQTLFMVSHAERDLKRFCKRGLYLRKGELIADGPMGEILEQYKSEEG